MDLVPIDLRAASLGARDQLARLSSVSASVGVGPGAGSRLQATMARTAREAIFADALLGAIRARFEEIRTVTK